MMKKFYFLVDRCVFILLICFLTKSSYGQVSFNFGMSEAGITISPSNFLGDLGGNAGRGGPFLKDNNISNTKLLVGAHFSVAPNEWLGFRFAFTHGTIAGDDALIQSHGGLEEARKARNQSFKSKINEAIIAAEFYPTVFLEADAYNRFHKIRPYFLIGVGVFNFNPQGQDLVTGKWFNLKDLHTEGQGFPEYPDRKEYKLIQLNIPMGIGVKYYLNDKVSISLEFIHRKTFTDYIDDVSTTYIDKDLFYKNLPLATAIISNRMYDKSVGFANRNAGEKRGEPTNNDAFYSTGIKFSFRLGDDAFNRNSMRCPVIRL
ncbi:MAG: DUF6089 family protein [Chitinophagaceae bacterium]